MSFPHYELRFHTWKQATNEVWKSILKTLISTFSMFGKQIFVSLILQTQVWKLHFPHYLSFNENIFHSLEMCYSIHGKVANLTWTFSFPQLLKFNLDHFPPLVNGDYIIGCQQNQDWK